MDVAYRLFPEVDMYDMAGDVKRAEYKVLEKIHHSQALN